MHDKTIHLLNFLQYSLPSSRFPNLIIKDFQEKFNQLIAGNNNNWPG